MRVRGDGVVEVDFGLTAGLDDNGAGGVGEDAIAVSLMVSLMDWSEYISQPMIRGR